MTEQSARRPDGLVSISERMRYLHVFRVLAVVMSLVAWIALPSQRGMGLLTLLFSAAVYAALSAATGYVWRTRAERNLLLIGAMLLVDGAYLATVAYVGGGVTSPLRYAVLVHLLVVSLLASYRTGVKLAAWHSLLLFLFFKPESGHVLHVAASVLQGRALTDDVLVFGISMWVVTITTSTFSAVNERELRRRNIDLGALALLGQRLETAADSDAVGDALVELVVEELGFGRTVLITGLPAQPHVLSHHGLAEVTARPEDADDLVLHQAAERHAPVLLRRLTATDDPWLSMLLPDARNLVAIGLHASGTTAAVLVCEMPPGQGRIERRLLSMVERFAAHAALALDKARLVERLDRLATTDGLTELATRRSFDAQLARELALSDRSGEPLSMLLLDIDHFKRINDEHGHPVGDIVLRAVASALKAEIGERGLVARYGGEEFAVLLSGVTREAASEISERLRQVVRQLTLDVAVSVSVGAATYPTSADGAYGLVHACDEALYASKRGGRDRVTVAPLTATPMLPSQTRVPGS